MPLRPVPSDTRARFAALAARPDDDVDVLEGALLIAREAYPDLDEAECEAAFARLAEGARPGVEAAASAPERVRALIDYLHHEERFRGNSEAYYDPRNSFLNEVLARRLGIPITLALVYVEVGRRTGVSLQGVAFPGHFLVRCGGEPPTFFDPFSPGELMSAADCAALLQRLSDGKATLEPELLEPAPPRQILVRMLRNLKRVYLESGELELAVAAIDRILLLAPEYTQEYRDRGVAQLQLEAFVGALADLSRYAADNPRCEPEIEAAIAELQTRVALLN